MINFFKLAENDVSLVYLKKIFGSMGGLLPGDGSITMFSSMFGTFNAIILAVGALVIVYMTVVGVMATAHEGEFMGKKWNNIWIPIRTVLGVAVLVPTASGYSSLQYVVMWIVIQGVAAADTVWSTTLTARAILNTPYGDVSLPDTGVQSSLSNIFKGLVCDATSRLTYANPSGLSKGGYFCSGGKNCGAPTAFNTTATSMQMGPNGVCGTMTYCNIATDCPAGKENSMKCLACQSQLSALESIIPALSAIAQQLADTDYMYRDFTYHSSNQPDNPNWKPVYDYCEAKNIPKEQCCVPNVTGQAQTCQGNTPFPSVDTGDSAVPYQSASDQAVSEIYWPYALSSSLSVAGSSSDFMSTIKDQYMGELTAGYSKYIQIAAQSGNSYGDAKISIMGVEIPAGLLFQQADSWGWAFGGVFYYMIATEGGGPSGLQDAVPALDASLTAIQSNLMDFRTNVSAADALVSTASDAASANAGSAQAASFKMNITKGMAKPMKILLTPIQEAFNAINKVLSTVLKATGGPLTGLALLGQVLMLTGAALYAIIFIATAVLGGVSLINVYAVGTGMDSPIYGFVMLMTIMFTPLVYLICGWMIGFGIICAVYIPLIPYIVFTFGVIGWMIAVIEAMVAAPLVALGILSPSGQHELMGKAEPAIMMMLNIFLRPSLMLFGLIAAMLLAVVVVELIFNSFFVVIMFVSGGVGLANPIVLVAFISVLIILIMSALNKCFTMIHLIPSQVMQWIGGHHVPGGHDDTANVLGEAKGGVQKVGASVDGKAITKHGQDIGQAHKARGEAIDKKRSPTLTAKKDE